MSEKAREALETFVSLDDQGQHDALLMAIGAAVHMGPYEPERKKGDAAGGSSGVEQRGSA